MPHPVDVEGYTLAELATAVGSLRYDRLSEFLTLLAEDLRRQAQGDRQAGRVQLSNKLTSVAGDVDKSAQSMSETFELCRPFMRDELDRSPS